MVLRRAVNAWLEGFRAAFPGPCAEIAVAMVVVADALFAKIPQQLDAAFRKAYQTNYGGVLPAGTLEVVTWRVVGATDQDIKRFVWPGGVTSEATARPEPKARRAIFCTQTDSMSKVPVYDRYALGGGTRLRGPVILEEQESTIVVPIEADVEVLDDLSVLIHLGAE